MEKSKTYSVNQTVEGIVTSIKNYGAFLSFENGYIGLLHISEISKNFVNDIYKYFNVGDKVTVLIKEVDKGTKFLLVSIKDLSDELNIYKDINPSKKITSYLKDIDSSKLSSELENMTKEELDRENKYGN